MLLYLVLVFLVGTDNGSPLDYMHHAGYWLLMSPVILWSKRAGLTFPCTRYLQSTFSHFSNATAWDSLILMRVYFSNSTFPNNFCRFSFNAHEWLTSCNVDPKCPCTASIIDAIFVYCCQIMTQDTMTRQLVCIWNSAWSKHTHWNLSGVGAGFFLCNVLGFLCTCSISIVAFVHHQAKSSMGKS